MNRRYVVVWIATVEVEDGERILPGAIENVDLEQPTLMGDEETIGEAVDDLIDLVGSWDPVETDVGGEGW